MVKSRMLRGVGALLNAVFFALYLLRDVAGKDSKSFLEAGAEHYKDTFGVVVFYGDYYLEVDLGLSFYCAEGGFVVGVEAVINGCGHFFLLNRNGFIIFSSALNDFVFSTCSVAFLFFQTALNVGLSRLTTRCPPPAGLRE